MVTPVATAQTVRLADPLVLTTAWAAVVIPFEGPVNVLAVPAALHVPVTPLGATKLVVSPVTPKAAQDRAASIAEVCEA